MRHVICFCFSQERLSRVKTNGFCDFAAYRLYLNTIKRDLILLLSLKCAFCIEKAVYDSVDTSGITLADLLLFLSLFLMVVDKVW